MPQSIHLEKFIIPTDITHFFSVKKSMTFKQNVQIIYMCWLKVLGIIWPFFIVIVVGVAVEPPMIANEWIVAYLTNQAFRAIANNETIQNMTAQNVNITTIHTRAHTKGNSDTAKS